MATRVNPGVLRRVRSPYTTSRRESSSHPNNRESRSTCTLWSKGLVSRVVKRGYRDAGRRDAVPASTRVLDPALKAGPSTRVLDRRAQGGLECAHVSLCGKRSVRASY